MKFFTWLKNILIKPRIRKEKKKEFEIDKDFFTQDPQMVVFNELFNILTGNNIKYKNKNNI
jgi:hypothetical protein